MDEYWCSGQRQDGDQRGCARQQQGVVDARLEMVKQNFHNDITPGDAELPGYFDPSSSRFAGNEVTGV